VLKMFTATIRDGALVLPEGADLGLSEEGDEVQVAVEVAESPDHLAAAESVDRVPRLRSLRHASLEEARVFEERFGPAVVIRLSDEPEERRDGGDG
jgi:hypothetical protein